MHDLAHGGLPGGISKSAPLTEQDSPGASLGSKTLAAASSAPHTGNGSDPDRGVPTMYFTDELLQQHPDLIERWLTDGTDSTFQETVDHWSR